MRGRKKSPTHELLQTLQLRGEKKPKLVMRAGLSSWDPHIIDTCDGEPVTRSPTGGLGYYCYQMMSMAKHLDSEC